MAYWAWSQGWEGWGRLRFKDRDSQKRGTGLAQGGMEKEGEEPRILIPSTRLGSYRPSTSGQNVGEKINKGHWIKNNCEKIPSSD